MKPQTCSLGGLIIAAVIRQYWHSAMHTTNKSRRVPVMHDQVVSYLVQGVEKGRSFVFLFFRVEGPVPLTTFRNVFVWGNIGVWLCLGEIWYCAWRCTEKQRNVSGVGLSEFIISSGFKHGSGGPLFFTDLRTTSCFFFLLKESFDESEAWGVGVSFPGCAL